jgi:UDP-N-acetylglucosamine---dolichyl-phosphate N-acetylglucosaminyltransferase
MREVFIIIPAFNEAKAIGKVLDDLLAIGYNKIIVIDDGSRDETFNISKNKGVVALRHIINRGKGAATQTGIDAARLLGADYAVTIDADGQHNPHEIESLLEPLFEDKYDVALGSRLISKSKMPLSRKIVNRIGNLITYFFYGIYVSDSQSGMRAYNRKALSCINTTFDRYEFESEVLHQINIHKLRYIEIPITVTYSDYSMNKWKHIQDVPAQTFMNGFKMVFKMIIRSITT